MRSALCCILLLIAQSNLAFGRGSIGVGQHIARIIVYTIQIETRIGYLDCDLMRRDNQPTKVVSCTYLDGSTVPRQELVRLGLIEESEEDLEKLEAHTN